MHHPPRGTTAEMAELGLSSARLSKGKSRDSRASSKTGSDKRQPLGTVNEARVPVAAAGSDSAAAVMSLQGSGALTLEVISVALGTQPSAEGTQDEAEQ